MFYEILGSIFFLNSTNLPNKNNAFSFWVLKEYLQAVDEVCSIEWITTNTNAQSLAQASLKRKANMLDRATTKQTQEW